jgi:hypothetical protein
VRAYEYLVQTLEGALKDAPPSHDTSADYFTVLERQCAEARMALITMRRFANEPFPVEPPVESVENLAFDVPTSVAC